MIDFRITGCSENPLKTSAQKPNKTGGRQSPPGSSPSRLAERSHPGAGKEAAPCGGHRANVKLQLAPRARLLRCGAGVFSEKGYQFPVFERPNSGKYSAAVFPPSTAFSPCECQ